MTDNDTGAQPLDNESDIRHWLSARVADHVGVEPREIDPTRALRSYGYRSIHAIALLRELSLLVQRDLSVTLFWEHPTIDALARAVCSGATDDTTSGAAASRALPAAGEPIAIVGMASRFPDSPSNAAFWQFLRDGRDGLREIPEDRWNIDEFYHADLAIPGKMITRTAGFLEDIDQFEPLFFGISPREAEEMDPQQRLVLQLAWEALEDAGIPASAIKGSRTGVFVGAIWREYGELSSHDLEGIGGQRATGQALNMIAHRVSYIFGLEGPSLVVDTACSSSLMAIHLGCQSLQSGDSEMALVGGINLILSPTTMIALSKFGGLAPDGRCKAFDASADGFGRGEGGGMVVLKPLSRAIRDGDPIWSVIHGSAVNNDGASNGLTAPNPRAQEDVLSQAYHRANISPREVGYVEAHGTGTSLGDPIEAKALGRILGQERPAEKHLRIGSVKTNIGHLEGAAGIAGVIKTSLALWNRELPASLHFHQPNPHIPFEDLGLQVVDRREPWPTWNEPHVAGVSSFGWGGTNAHIVLGESPGNDIATIMLSAESESALRLRAERARRLIEEREIPLVKIQAHLDGQPEGDGAWRLAVTARSSAEFCTHISSHLDGRATDGVRVACASGDARGPVFVCSPQGSQWLGMARRLMATEPVFRHALTQCDAALHRVAGWSLLDYFLAVEPSARHDDCDVVQPCLVAVQIALASQLRSWGVLPDVVVGHSIGEVSAAHIAGILDLDDTFLIAHHYSRLQSTIAGRGRMAIVESPGSELEDHLAGFGDRAVIGGYNSPTSTIVSGEASALEAVLEGLKAKDVRGAWIKVNVAAHSPQIDQIRGECDRLLQGVQPMSGLVAMFSTLTGERITDGELDGSYFSKNLRHPVQFAGVMETLLRQGYDTFVELSPTPILCYAMEEVAGHLEQPATIIGTLNRGHDERIGLYRGLGQLFVNGMVGRTSDRADAGERDEQGEAHRDLQPENEHDPHDAEHILVLSARSRAALCQLAGEMSHWVADHPEHRLHDICYTSSLHRDHHEHRAAVMGRSREELSRALHEVEGDGEIRMGAVGHRPGGKPASIVFVFPGQGSQWPGMGRQLMQQERAFHDAIRACDEVIRDEAGWSLIDLLTGPDDAWLGRIDMIQPALFAVQVSLATLWRSWGVEPDAVIGHSMGEVAASHIAGGLSLRDAARIICRRSKLLRRVSGQGAMALVELSSDGASEELRGREDAISIAVSNSPRSTVLSGDPDALEAVLSALEARGVFCRRIKVDVASHSPQMDPLRPDLLAALQELSPRECQIPMYSTVHGEPMRGTALDADYWVSNLREPVLFSRSVERALDDRHELFVEISPHPILLPAIQERLLSGDTGGAALPSLRRNEDERHSLLESLCALYSHGYPVAWERFHPRGGRCVRLPQYPWNGASYWIAPRSRGEGRGGRTGHPFLHDSFPLSSLSGVHVSDGRLSLERAPYLRDHKVQDAVLLPGAAFLELALAAVKKSSGWHSFALGDVQFSEALVLSDGESHRVQVTLTERDAGARGFRVVAAPMDRGENSWTLHAQGEARPRRHDSSAPEETGESVQEIRDRCTENLSGPEHYRVMGDNGLIYGPAFQAVKELWMGEKEALARLELSQDQVSDAGRYLVHPALLDAGLQALLCGLIGSFGGDVGPFVPIGISQLTFDDRPGVSSWAHVRWRAIDDSVGEGDLCLLDESGRVLLKVAGVRLQRLHRASRDGHSERVFMAPRWVETALCVDDGPSPVDSGRWLVVADEREAGRAVCAGLRERGEDVVYVAGGDGVADPQADHVISFGDSSGFDRVVQALGADGTPCRGVVYLQSRDALIDEERGQHSILETTWMESYGGALLLVQALLRTGWRDMPRLWLVTCGANAIEEHPGPLRPTHGALWGLGRTLCYEHGEFCCTRVDLDPASFGGSVAPLLDELMADSSEDEIGFRDGKRYVAELRPYLPASSQEEISIPPGDEPFRLEVATPGLLDQLALRPCEPMAVGPDDVRVVIDHAGLNFIDVMKAMGVYPGSEATGILLGGECAGRIVMRGSNVESLQVGQQVVVASPGHFASQVVVPASLVRPRPSQLSSRQASTIPLVFMTAWHALYDLGRLQRGDRILIHSAAGGTGLAAIQLARRVGAEIFATAGSEEKRAHLRSLGIEHVMHSRTFDFVDEIARITEGRGVDVILNSLAGEAIEKNLSILASDGRFLELGKRDIHDDLRNIPLSFFRKRISFHAIDLLGLLDERPERYERLFDEVISAFAREELTPLPVESVAISRAEGAFRTMASAQHIGKMTLEFADPLARVIAPAGDARLFRSDASYVITGGLGGLGLETARWMGRCGARNLVLVGRNGVTSAEQAEAISELETAGVQILVYRADVGDREQVRAMMDAVARDMPPLRGVFHAAGVLRDALVVGQDRESFLAVSGPKIAGAWNLHVCTSDVELEFFVMYSSVASLIGNPGQSNYAAANAFMDGLAHHRRSRGLPGISVNWGAFSEVGLAAADDNRGDRLAQRGMQSMEPGKAMEYLARVLDESRAQVGIVPIDIRQWVESYPQIAGSSLFRHMLEISAMSNVGEQGLAVLDVIRREPPASRRVVVEDFIAQEVGRVLRIDAAQLERHTPLKSYGIDSLTGLELRNRLEATFGLEMTATLLWTYPTISALGGFVIAQLALVDLDDGDVLADPGSEGDEMAVIDADAARVEELAALDDAEAEALLEEKLRSFEERLQYE